MDIAFQTSFLFPITLLKEKKNHLHATQIKILFSLFLCYLYDIILTGRRPSVLDLSYFLVTQLENRSEKNRLIFASICVPCGLKTTSGRKRGKHFWIPCGIEMKLKPFFISIECKGCCSVGTRCFGCYIKVIAGFVTGLATNGIEKCRAGN